MSAFPKIICLLAPMSLALELDAGSRVYVAELLLPLSACAMTLFQGKKVDFYKMKILFFLLLLYFFFQIFSDLWNSSLYEQYSRGWARIFLFAINFLAIYVLVNNKRMNLILFACGFAFGRIIITFYSFEGDGIPWKIGLAKPIALLLILFIVIFPMRKTIANYVGGVVILALGLFDIVMDFRSHGLVLILVSALLFASTAIGGRSDRRRSRQMPSTIGVAIVGIVATLVAYQFYVHAAQSGWLSEGATRKFEAQVENADAPLLVTGRSEVLVYFETIFDSLFIGHGSWPRNKYYADKLANERYDQGLSNSQANIADDAIPIHSHLFGGWIEAGIFGGIFWIYLLLLIAKSLLKSTMGLSRLRPLYLYGALLLAWDIFFSPFSGFRRLETAFLIVIVLRALLQRVEPAHNMARKIRSRRISKRSRRRMSGKGRKVVKEGRGEIIRSGIT